MKGHRSYGKKENRGKRNTARGRSQRDGPAGRCGGTAHHRHAGRELYALRHVGHRQPRHPGDRRLQALPPKAAVHHVQNGPADRQPHQERQHRGPDHAPEPPRRPGHLRDHGPPGQGQRVPAAPLCGQQGQLRQGVLPGHGLCRQPVHRGQAGPHLRRAVP